MLDIDAQIRAYIDATSEPLTATELLREAGQKPAGLAPSRRSSTPGWLIAAAAAIIVLLLGLIPLLLANDEQTPVTTPSVPVATTQPETVTTTQTPAPVEGSDLELTGVSIADRYNGPAPSIDDGEPPITVDSPLGPITWVRYDSRGPGTVTPLDEGGYVARITCFGCGAPAVWYTDDGREWFDWTDTETLYAGYNVYWLVGDWAMTYPLGKDPALVNDTLWHRSDGTWHEVALPEGTHRVSRPVSSEGVELLTVTGGATDYVITSTDERVIYYQAPWRPHTSDESDLQIQPKPRGAFAAFSWAPFEIWTSAGGSDWTLVDHNPFDLPDVHGFATANIDDTLWVELWIDTGDGVPTTFSYWSSTDAVNWTEADPPLAPNGENWVREDYFNRGQQRPIDTPVGLIMSIGSNDEFQASLDGGATWVDVSGPPWVEGNDQRGYEGWYQATQDFLLAGDPNEGWIGYFGE